MSNTTVQMTAPGFMAAPRVADHYWIIGGSTSEVYASVTNTLVPADDADYAEWAAHHAASPIVNEAELADVLRSYGTPLPEWLLASPSFIQPTPGTYSKDQLRSYAGYARWSKQTGGIVVNSIPFPTDALTLGSLNSYYIYATDKQSSTFSWKLPDGSFVTLNTQQIKDLQTGVSKFGQDCFACEDQVLFGIESGTITTLEQIDTALAAVSNVYTSATTLKVRHQRTQATKD
jgi:hypothetical protein